MNEIVKFLASMESLIDTYLIGETNKTILTKNFKTIFKALLSNEDNIEGLIKANPKAHKNLLFYFGFCIKTASDFTEQDYDHIENIAFRYIDNRSMESFQEGVAYFLLSFFNSIIIKFKSTWNKAEILFKLIESMCSKDSFSITKAFLAFFAYNKRNYSLVEGFMDRFFIPLEKKYFNLTLGFIMFNYYKGIIHLSKENFSEAAVCFMICIEEIFESESTCFTYFQIESYKRLIFLSGICDEEMSLTIISKLKASTKMICIKGFKHYKILSNTLIKKEMSPCDYLNFVLSHKDKLVYDKLYVR